MILSFHPCFEGDRNIICAGRPPGPSDLAAIQAARAVILPQGCKQELYDLASNNCPNIFPNFDVKFNYHGKIGQIRFFQKYQVPHPETLLFENLSDFQRILSDRGTPLPYPFVLKLDWGGEGEGVFPIDSEKEMPAALAKIAAFEVSGQKGFLAQEFISCGNRSLRVVVIGERLFTYWRVQEKGDFFSNVSKGAMIDHAGDPHLQQAGQVAVENLCSKTGINLAGFDLLFADDRPAHSPTPLFLEINYFFGRSGLGGSDIFYHLLTEEIQKWLCSLG